MCNGYPTFEQGPRYPAQGSLAPCDDGFPGDGAFGISMNETTACGREGWPAVTLVIPWGAERRGTGFRYDNNFVGTELDPKLGHAGVAEACGVTGATAPTMEEVTTALSESCEAQAAGVTSFIEAILNRELGERFPRTRNARQDREWNTRDTRARRPDRR